MGSKGWRAAGHGLLVVALATLAGIGATHRDAGAVVAVACAVLTAWWLASRPRQAWYAWLGALCLAPVWATVSVGAVELPPSTLAALVVLPACLAPSSTPDRWRKGDSLMVVVVAMTAALTLVSDSPRYVLSALLVHGVTSYLVARRLGVRVGTRASQRAVAHLTVIVAVWALVEFALGLHVFSGLEWSSDLSFWNDIQVRGEYERSEAAWGHAIALGGWLSIGLPFVMVSGLRHASLCVVLVVGASLATLSRGPILACLFGFVLVVLFSGRIGSARRSLWVVALLLFGFAAAPAASNVVGEARTELDSTQEYRASLLDSAASDLHWFSVADFVTFDDGRLRYHGLGSIDNAFLLMALEMGVLIALLYATALLAALWRVLRRKGTAADIALSAQVVVLATVAMITQYQAAVYFTAGLAVTLAGTGRFHPRAERAGDGEQEARTAEDLSPRRP